MDQPLTTKQLRRRIARAARELPPDEVFELFVAATRARVAAGLGPQAELGHELRRLAGAAGRDQEGAIREILREILGLPGIVEASINFWLRHLDVVRELGCDEAVRDLIAGIVPTQFTPEASTVFPY